MPKGLSGIALANVRTLGALEKSSVTKITQTVILSPQKNVELAVNEGNEGTLKSPFNRQGITYPQSC